MKQVNIIRSYENLRHRSWKKSEWVMAWVRKMKSKEEDEIKSNDTGKLNRKQENEIESNDTWKWNRKQQGNENENENEIEIEMRRNWN